MSDWINELVNRLEYAKPPKQEIADTRDEKPNMNGMRYQQMMAQYKKGDRVRITHPNKSIYNGPNEIMSVGKKEIYLRNSNCPQGWKLSVHGTCIVEARPDGYLCIRSGINKVILEKA